MPFCVFLPPFPYLEIGNKDFYLFCTELLMKNIQVRIRVSIKHILFMFHCNKLGDSLILLFHCVSYIFVPLTSVDVSKGKEQLHICSLTRG